MFRWTFLNGQTEDTRSALVSCALAVFILGCMVWLLYQGCFQQPCPEPGSRRGLPKCFTTDNTPGALPDRRVGPVYANGSTSLLGMVSVM